MPFEKPASFGYRSSWLRLRARHPPADLQFPCNAKNSQNFRPFWPSWSGVRNKLTKSIPCGSSSKQAICSPEQGIVRREYAGRRPDDTHVPPDSHPQRKVCGNPLIHTACFRPASGGSIGRGTPWRALTVCLCGPDEVGRRSQSVGVSDALTVLAGRAIMVPISAMTIAISVRLTHPIQ